MTYFPWGSGSHTNLVVGLPPYEERVRGYPLKKLVEYLVHSRPLFCQN